MEYSFLFNKRHIRLFISTSSFDIDKSIFIYNTFLLLIFFLINYVYVERTLVIMNSCIHNFNFYKNLLIKIFLMKKFFID